MASTLLTRDEVHKKMMAVRLAAQQQALSASRVERQERQLEHRRLALDDRQQQHLLSAAVGPEAALAARSQRLQQQTVTLADLEQRAFEEVRSRRLLLSTLEAEIEESKSANAAVERLLEDASKTLQEAARMAEDQRREEDAIRLETLHANLRQKELDIRELASTTLEATIDRLSVQIRHRDTQDVSIQEVASSISNELIRNASFMGQLSELVQSALKDPCETGATFKDRCNALNLRQASPYSMMGDQVSPSDTDDRFGGGEHGAPASPSPFDASRGGQGPAFFDQKDAQDEASRLSHCRSSPGRLASADQEAASLFDVADTEGASTQTESAIPSLVSGSRPPLKTAAVGQPLPAASSPSAWSRHTPSTPVNVAVPPQQTATVPMWVMGGPQGRPTNVTNMMGPTQQIIAGSTVPVGGSAQFAAHRFHGTSPGAASMAVGPPGWCQTAPAATMPQQRPMFMQYQPSGPIVRLVSTGPTGQMGSSLRAPSSSNWAANRPVA
mmetsp:Transcript_65643/g.137209  ORF Transcript_65643/g.137209 Transcript_65643/m.137209 type:complete len:500 (-) Transcript_65643:257-1756(-)